MERGVVYVDDGLVENLRDVVEELRARALDLAPLVLLLRRLLRGLLRVRDGEQTPLGGLDEDACALVEFLVVAYEFDLLVRQVLALPRRGEGGGAGERDEEGQDEGRGCLDVARLVHGCLSSGARADAVCSLSDREAAARRQTGSMLFGLLLHFGRGGRVALRALGGGVRLVLLLARVGDDRVVVERGERGVALLAHELYRVLQVDGVLRGQHAPDGFEARDVFAQSHLDALEEVAHLVVRAPRTRRFQEAYGVVNDGLVDSQFSGRGLEAVGVRLLGDAREPLFGEFEAEARARLRVALGFEPAAHVFGHVAHRRRRGRRAVHLLLLRGGLLREGLAAREREERDDEERARRETAGRRETASRRRRLENLRAAIRVHHCAFLSGFAPSPRFTCLRSDGSRRFTFSISSSFVRASARERKAS